MSKGGLFTAIVVTEPVLFHFHSQLYFTFSFLLHSFINFLFMSYFLSLLLCCLLVRLIFFSYFFFSRLSCHYFNLLFFLNIFFCSLYLPVSQSLSLHLLQFARWRDGWAVCEAGLHRLWQRFVFRDSS